MSQFNDNFQKQTCDETIKALKEAKNAAAEQVRNTLLNEKKWNDNRDNTANFSYQSSSLQINGSDVYQLPLLTLVQLLRIFLEFAQSQISNNRKGLSDNTQVYSGFNINGTDIAISEDQETWDRDKRKVAEMLQTTLEARDILKNISLESSSEIATIIGKIQQIKPMFVTISQTLNECHAYRGSIDLLKECDRRVNSVIKEHADKPDFYLRVLLEKQLLIEQFEGYRKLLTLRETPPLSLAKLEIAEDGTFPKWLQDALKIKGLVNRLLEPAMWEGNLPEAMKLFTETKNAPGFDQGIAVHYTRTHAAETSVAIKDPRKAASERDDPKALKT